MSGTLPPAVQEFVLNAAGYLAGINEMIAANVRLSESVKVTQTEMHAMGAAGASAAQRDLAAAEKLAADGAVQGAAANARLTESQKAVRDSAAAAAASQKEAAAAQTKAVDGLNKLGKMTTLAGVAFAASSVKMAAGFDQAMTMIHTQAGAADEDIKKLGNQVLALSGTVGIGPEKLAQGLYHVESAGFRGKAAMDILASASKLAAIGQSDFETTAQAVVGVMASEIKGVKDANDAGALLNTTVGIGDMRMQQLGQAIATGILPKAKQAGLSFEDVGAALATLTDNVTPANEAATRLGMTFSLMSAPTEKAKKALNSIGMSSVGLANDIRSKGLYGALVDLQAHLDKTYPPSQKLKLSLEEQRKELGRYSQSLTDSGVPVAQQTTMLAAFKKKLDESGSAAVKQSAALSAMFGGGKSSGAVLTLLGEMDRLKTKTDAFGNSSTRAKQLQQAWAEQQKQFSQQVKDLEAKFQVLEVRVGNFLIPKLQALAGFLVKHQTLAKTLAGIIAGVLVISVVSFGVKAVASAVQAVGAFAKFGVSAAKAGVDAAQGLGRMADGFKNASAAESAFSGKMGTLGGKLRSVSDAAGSGFGKVTSGARAAATGVASFSGKMLEAAKSAASMSVMLAKAAYGYTVMGLKAAAAAVKIAAVAVVEGVVKAATAAWTAVQWLLNVAMDANPIGLLVVAIAAAVAAVIYAYTHFKWFHDLINTIFSWIKSHWPLLLAILVGPIGIAVYFIIKHWNAIKDAFMTAVHWVLGFLKNNWPLLLAILTGPIGIAVYLVIKYWKQITGAVSDAVSWVIGFVKAHWPLLLAILTGPVGLAVLFIKSHWDQITGFFQAGVNRVKTIVNWFAGLPGMFRGWFMAAYHAVVSALGSLIGAVAGLPGKVWNALSHLYNDMLTVGKDIVIGIWNGLVSMGSWLYNSLMSWVSSMIPGPIKKVLGISSPSKLMHGYGQNIGQGLAAGMLSRYDHVRAAAEGLAKTAAAGMDKTVKGTVALSASGTSRGLSGQLVASMTGPGGAYRGGGAGQAGGTVINVKTIINGTVTAQRDLEKGIQQAVLQANVRNPTNNYSLPPGR